MTGPADRVGEHTEAILSQFGFSDREIEQLLASGAASTATGRAG